MGNHKRYVGVRLYISTSKTQTPKGGETSVDVQSNEMGMGSNGFSIKSKREQYKDSRFVILRSGSCYYLYLLSKLAALSIASATIAGMSENWKGYGFSAMLFVIGTAYMVRTPIISWIKKLKAA